MGRCRGARDDGTASAASASVLGVWDPGASVVAAHLHLIEFGRIRSVCDDRRPRSSDRRRRRHREKSEIRRVGGRGVNA